VGWGGRRVGSYDVSLFCLNVDHTGLLISKRGKEINRIAKERKTLEKTIQKKHTLGKKGDRVQSHIEE